MRKLVVIILLVLCFVPMPTLAKTYTVTCQVPAQRSATWAKDGFLPTTINLSLVRQISGENTYNEHSPIDGLPEWQVNGVHVVPRFIWVGLIEFYSTARPTVDSKIAVVRVASQPDWPSLYFVFVYTDWTQDHPRCGFAVDRAFFNAHIKAVWL